MEALRRCQRTALEFCKNQDKGIVRMCCGSGKTRVEVELCAQEQISCLIAPRNSLIDQHQKLLKKFGLDYIIINCENDKKSIKIEKNKKICIIINNASLENLPCIPDIVVVDEAHTHKNSVKETEFIRQAKRRYFFTATPQEMDDVDFYGEVIFTYDYSEALEDGIVCPIKIVPIWKNEKIHEKIEAEMINRTLSHCIHYYETVEAENNSVNSVDVNLYTNEVFKISAKISKEDRELKFKVFRDKGGHLVSCQTISYGIDFQECDSVYLNKIFQSIADLIQKIMRCIRKYKKNPNKIGHVFIRMDIDDPLKTDITEEMKYEQQSLLCTLISALENGLDLKIFENYSPFKRIAKNKKIIEQLEDIRNKKTEELQQLIQESSEVETEENNEKMQNMQQDLVSLDECIREENSHLETLENKAAEYEEKDENKKVPFNQIFEDLGIQFLNTNGELKTIMDRQKIDYRKCLEDFLKDNPGKKPSEESNNLTEYNGKTEKQIRRWIKSSINNIDDRKFIEERIPNCYPGRNICSEEDTQKSFLEFINLNPGKIPSKASESSEKYYKKTEKELANWIGTSKGREFRNQHIQAREIEYFTDEEYKESFKYFFENEERKPVDSKKSRNLKEKYLKIKEYRLAGWMKLCEFNDNKSFIEKLLPKAYDKKDKKDKLSIEDKKESLLDFIKNNNNKRPRYNKKNNILYHKMLEIELAIWLQDLKKTKNKELKNFIEGIKWLEDIDSGVSDLQSNTSSQQEEEQITETSEEDSEIRPKKKFKPNQKSEEEIRKEIEEKFQDPEYREKQIEKQKQKEINEKIAKQGYTAPNKEWKDKINKIIASNINPKVKGNIIVLDHTDFGTTTAIYNVNPKLVGCIKIPNNTHANEMKQHEQFGSCVIDTDLETYLNEMKNNQTSIKAIYADLCGHAPHILEQISKCNLTRNCIVAFTMSARGGVADFTNSFATELLNKNYKLFKNSENLLDEPAVFVYGEGNRMATTIFRVNCK